MQETVLPPSSVAGIMSAAKYLDSLWAWSLYRPLWILLQSFLSYLRTFVSIVKNEEVYLSCSES